MSLLSKSKHRSRLLLIFDLKLDLITFSNICFYPSNILLQNNFRTTGFVRPSWTPARSQGEKARRQLFDFARLSAEARHCRHPQTLMDTESIPSNLCHLPGDSNLLLCTFSFAFCPFQYLSWTHISCRVAKAFGEATAVNAPRECAKVRFFFLRTATIWSKYKQW